MSKAPWPGEFHRRTNRTTGTTIVLVDNEDPEETGIDTGDQRWATVCHEHGTILSSPTRRDCHLAGSHPDDWCDDCRALAEAGEKYNPDAEEDDPEPIRIRLTEFQADEVSHGLTVDAETNGREIWGEIERTGKTTAWLTIHDVDGAVYRVTSSRDICRDNATTGTGKERVTAATRARSLQSLVEKILDEAGGPEALEPSTRHWL